MLDSFLSIFTAVWHQDFVALKNPESILMIYFCVTFVIWLESAFLPAAPLPCDSIVILSGTLGAMGIIDYKIIFILLVAASATGSWLAYLQGRWLDHLPKVQRWVKMVPPHRMQTVDSLLMRHGLVALFVARFIPVVRPLLPLMMGLRVKSKTHFYRFTWVSATAWVGLLTVFGYSLKFLPEKVAHVVTIILMVAPLITLAVAVCSVLAGWLLRRKKRNAEMNQTQVEQSIK
ncbi:Inner membrane protein YghB [Photobacterium damselae subsp. piscicida]|uniref:DedA family protein n=1 Tax=Photobacterium damsela subsp. piscicida TaxID=38294 RepID=A0A1V1VBD0_PHODP|nr:DedA family protein [Photobacterium damselae]MBE8129448.1 DedA family protein [Photobacterium damselae subsp. piscicida]MDP2532932.1 DedA family protein [Photobacterium damselae subsp. piscicida]MDP2558995.1 DedA family protein [Photobacterium damselae subsp. piscicida]PSV65062.1 DedA family protein [Photobacterium damselae]PSW76515.1 DedA family protein [Photobacterium damselae]